MKADQEDVRVRTPAAIKFRDLSVENGGYFCTGM
jgi:hypothetical protein